MTTANLEMSQREPEQTWEVNTCKCVSRNLHLHQIFCLTLLRRKELRRLVGIEAAPQTVYPRETNREVS